MSERPVLLVTGGSRGIGAAVCLAAAEQGWRVVVNYASNEAAAQDVVARIRDAGGEAWLWAVAAGEKAAESVPIIYPHAARAGFLTRVRVLHLE